MFAKVEKCDQEENKVVVMSAAEEGWVVLKY